MHKRIRGREDGEREGGREGGRDGGREGERDRSDHGDATPLLSHSEDLRVGKN